MGTNRRKILDELNRRNYKEYPIKNNLLKSADENTKDAYFTNLALLLLQNDEEVSEERKLVYLRLLAGSEMEKSMEQFIKTAAELEFEDYLDFMQELQETELRYRFVLDAIVLTGCDTSDDEAAELTGAFMEILKIPFEEARYLTAMGKSILEQNSQLYWDTLIEREADIDEDVTDDYTESYVTDYIKNDEEELRICYARKTPAILSDILDNELFDGELDLWEKIVLHNCIFIMENYNIQFNGIDHVTISSCEFLDGGKNLEFAETESVLIQNSKFANLSDTVMNVKAVKSINIKKCQFTDCKIRIDREEDFSIIRSIYPIVAYPIIIRSDNPEMNGLVTIYKSKFTNCKLGHSYSTSDSVVLLSNVKCRVINSEFSSCRSFVPSFPVLLFSSGGGIKQDQGSYSLFPPGTLNENNRLTECHSFSDPASGLVST